MVVLLYPSYRVESYQVESVVKPACLEEDLDRKLGIERPKNERGRGMVADEAVSPCSPRPYRAGAVAGSVAAGALAAGAVGAAGVAGVTGVSGVAPGADDSVVGLASVA